MPEIRELNVEIVKDLVRKLALAQVIASAECDDEQEVEYAANVADKLANAGSSVLLPDDEYSFVVEAVAEQATYPPEIASRLLGG